MQTPGPPFADYQFISLPDLSTLRHAPSSRELISVRSDADCSEEIVLVALARCLGVYCAASDVLLGWQPVGSPCAMRQVTAARVNWANSDSYRSVVENLVLQQTENNPDSIRSTLGIQLDDGLQPFLAVLTPNLDYNHPLIAAYAKNAGSKSHTWTLTLKYSTLRFHASTAELLAKQVCAVATRIAEDPAFPPKHLDFLPDELLSIVPVRTNGSSYTHYPEVRTVADFIPRHDPSVVAIEYYPDLYDEDPVSFDRVVTHMTYGELDKHSNRFAAYLCAQGLGQEDRVTLCMPRGIEFHVAMMGVLKAGGCYVPIDPELPEERQRFINEDSNTRFIFTAENIAEHMSASKEYSSDDINNARSDGLAYLLYTSGTTGTPKGCLLTHDGFSQAIHALSWFANQAGPNKRRWPQAGRYLAVASIAFDVHLAETFVALSLGMTLICAPRSQLLEDLPRWLHRLRVTHVGIVPSLIEATMHAVAESAELSAGGQNSGVEGQSMELAYIASGGEKMSDSILDKWADHPLVTLANFYGPSEVTIGCSARLMTSATRKESIGRIFENCSAYVVDENLNLVIRGGMGELLVGGRLVGRGYLNRPDLTGKSFINYAHGPNRERVYRTGDLVRLMPDDTLEILGRIDTQIKLRGVRIESEGVSSVIRKAATEVPGMKSKTVPDVSTILSRHPQLKTDQLVSFIGLDSSKSVALRRKEQPRVLNSVPKGLMRALKEACARELASYMRPAHIVPLDFLPMNQNGKTDNKALDALFRSETLEVLGRANAQRGDESAEVGVLTRELNEKEAEIAKLLSRHIDVGHAELQPSSNLFQLGFDSLKLVRLAAQLRSSHNTKSVSVGNIIQQPTIEGIAALLVDVRTAEKGISRSSGLDKFLRQWRSEVEGTYGTEKVEQVLPTFPVQDGVLYRSADLSTLYIQHVVLKIHSSVDIQKLKRSWVALVSQHEILRTVFHFSSSLVQVVLKPGVCDLPWVERMIQADNNENFHASFLEGDALEFARTINENISSSPAFQLACYRAEDQSATFLTLSIHHAIYDGISLPLLLQDVEAIYFHENPPPPVPILQVLDAVHDVDLDEATAFYKREFHGFNWSKIPRRLASGETANFVRKSFNAQLSWWEQTAAKIKVSLQAVLTAAFGVTLGEQVYGVPDVVFGVIRSGRSFADDSINDARAPLLTVVPTRINANLGADLLQTVQRNIGAVLAYEHVPLSRVQSWVQPGRALFEVLFSVSVNDAEPTRLYDVVESRQPHADYILAVEVVFDKTNGQIRIDCAFTEPLKRHDVSRFLQSLEGTAKALVEGNHRATMQQSLLSDEEAIEAESDSGYASEASVDDTLEEKIRLIVSGFLKIGNDQISSTTSLIALGLDSIRSVGLSRALRRDGIEITSLDIMRHPSIRRIAARSSNRDNSSNKQRDEEENLLASRRALIASHVNVEPLKLGEADEVELYPTTILQAGMLSQTINSGGNLYIHAFPFQLSATIDTDRLQLAWRSAAQYFNILRTSFHFVEKMGAWIQAIHSVYNLDWCEVNECDGKTVLDVAEGCIRDLDLSSESKFSKPPVFARLSRHIGGNPKEPQSSTLILILHHALYDGISITQLSEAVRQFYHDETPSPSPQFVDLLGYFEYQDLYGSEFWIKQLHRFNRPVLPRKALRSSNSKSLSARAEIRLPLSRMQEASSIYDVTVQCFGQASFAKVLSTLYNERDVVFGHVVSGRNVHRAEDVLGPMISTLPHRSRIISNVKNLDFVRSIHGQNLEAQKWQHASLRTIQRKLGMRTLWDAIFLFQPMIDDGSREEDELWAFDDSEDEIAKIQYPLNIELHQHLDCLIVKAACQSEFFNESDLDVIVTGFTRSFTQLVDEPSAYTLPHLAVDDEERNQREQTADHDRAKSPVIDERVSKFIEVLASCVDVLRASIEPNTSMVSLGVDSITAIQISSRARKLGLQLQATDVLHCQAPQDVVKILQRKGCKTNARSSSHMEPQLVEALVERLGSAKEAVDGVYPASAGMEWLIGMWQLSDRAGFQHAFAFALPSDIDEEKLKRAWFSLVQSQPILRSTFVSGPDKTTHIVTFKDTSPERHWSRREAANTQCAPDVVETITKELVSNPLSTDLPPCQAVFLRTPARSYLILHLHHFQYDAWSLRLLMEDLQRQYEGNDAVYQRNVSLFLEKCNSSHTKNEQMQYWRTYLTSPFVPSLFPKRKNRTMIEHNRLFYIDRHAVRDVIRLREQAQDVSTSLNVIFLACWAQVQAKYSNAISATFGLWHLGRGGVVDDVESLPIPCMNVLPIHVERVDIPLRRLADEIQATLRDRSAIVQQSHLEDVCRWTNADTDRAMMNVFVNVVATAELKDKNYYEFLSPVELPYFIPRVQEAEQRPTVDRLAVCNIIEDAVLVDFAVIGEDVTMCIEYRNDYLDDKTSQGLVSDWALLVEETLR
ncbi:uncharacterized protein FOMMEDRAFT_119062 [Fomitiporia mediterranea MF3/22]|uniref:uncharacterized protein n=1 Tax=Fomitiporia mediterranea (strain MF3/22) TaxID=694068 RepID=UPI0004408EB0|nr:uncharacterized protein FOMMEDRAFT_119062 [Fomitiporia mediterranea MF3/22]EJD05778.1 hypothetical protein FOMMEDRAFT_119062 [Fomitiporia mediterranea MF3/22]